MKFLRLLLTCLAVLLTLAVVAVLVAIAPAVQTWVAQRELTGTPGVKGSLDSLSAGFGEVDVENLHLEAGGAVLTLPSLKAKLTLSDAVFRRRFNVQSLVAKGWSLDLTHSSGANLQVAGSATISNGGSVARAGAADMRRTVDTILGVLGQRRLPFDGSLDGVDMEGEVLFTPLPGKAPARVHVVLSGGGLSAGHQGVLNFDLSGTIPEESLPVSAASAHGRLIVSIDAQGTLNRVRIETELSDNSSSTLPSMTVGAEVSSEKDDKALTYRLDILRAGRDLATFTARTSGPNAPVMGTWAVDLFDYDFGRYFPDVPLPSGSLHGSGRFDSDAEFSSLHLAGTLNSDLSHLEAVAAALRSVDRARLGAEFEATRHGHEIRVDRLNVSIAGTQPVAALRSVQPFSLDDRNGALKASDPAGSLFDISIVGLPLAWLPEPASGIAVSGANATGEALIAQSNGGFDLQSKGPLVATGVSVLDGKEVLGKGLDLILSLAAHADPKGWQVQWAPLTVDRGGRRLAGFQGTASRAAGTDQPVALAVQWDADLDAIAAEGALPWADGLTGRSASGNFSASLGATAQVDGKWEVTGHDPRHSLSASAHADIDQGGVAFQAPIKLSLGPSASDLSLDGSCGRDSSGPWVNLKVNGGNVSLGDIRELAAPLAPPKRGDERDRSPFWGNLTGQVVVSIDKLRTANGELANVGGSFDIDKASIKLEGGHGGIPGQILTNIEGSIAFAAAADSPYSLKGTAAGTDVEASSFFPAPHPGEDPMFEGKYSVTRTFTGKGANVYDLAAHSQEEFHIVSTSGIIRLLKADVADSLPEAPSSAVSNTLGTVGSVVGSVMGTKKNILDSGKTNLSKTTEAVLDLTYQVSEIGFDKVDITADRGFDGTLRLVQMEMTSPEVRLRGTGQIASAPGHSLRDQVLSADLKLGAQGKTADLLSKAGLLSGEKDELGYAAFNQELHVSGTLSHPDVGQWTDLLVKAATSKPETAKKAD